MKITKAKLKQINKEDMSDMKTDGGKRTSPGLASSAKSYLFTMSASEVLNVLRDVVEFLEPIANEETGMEDYEGSQLRSLECRLEQAIMDFKNMVRIHENH